MTSRKLGLSTVGGRYSSGSCTVCAAAYGCDDHLGDLVTVAALALLLIGLALRFAIAT